MLCSRQMAVCGVWSPPLPAFLGQRQLQLAELELVLMLMAVSKSSNSSRQKDLSCLGLSRGQACEPVMGAAGQGHNFCWMEIMSACF